MNADARPDDVISTAQIDEGLRALTCAIQGRWYAPLPVHCRPSAEVLKKLEELRRSMGKDSSAAPAQWLSLSEMERRMLVAYAGLREMNPGEQVQSIAARHWGEFVTAERAAIAQAVRRLRQTLNRLQAITEGA